MLARLTADRAPWDVLVIGGGATGLGAAVDAVTRGYRTVLLERGDFAQATSSRSSKLIHGGVRYLRQGNLRLVRESLRERERLLRNAPHLVRPLPFILPAYRRGDRTFYGAGLWLYDQLAGHSSLAGPCLLSRTETLARLSTLNAQDLRGGVLYHDAQFDDTRLAVALAQTLVAHGGVALNAFPVVALRKEGSRVCGVRARDAETGHEYEIEARGVINATGIFSDEVRRLDEPESRALLTYSQGAHIVLPQAFLPGAAALLVPRTDDGRVLFAIPWLGRVLLGTTDTPIDRPSEHPRPLNLEVDYLLAHAARYLAQPPSRGDILSCFAGVRPLLRGKEGQTSRLARDFTVKVAPSGLVTVTGGKWTTYRAMGESAVDAATRAGALPARPCATRALRLHDAQPQLSSLLAHEPALREPLHPRLPYCLGDVVSAVRYEQARTVEDVLMRRTRAVILDAAASIEAAPRVATLLAQELKRDVAWGQSKAAAFTALARGYLPG